MDCNELVELVTEYLEGTLPALNRARFDAHIAECPYCEVYLQQMRGTLAVLGTIPPETIPVQAQDKLLAIFRSYKRS